MRARVLYADKSLPLTSFRYEDLANPKYKGKVCIRAGQHPYNTALVASMIAHDGEAKAEQWLRGVKANLARKATGGDRDVARDILGGICDIGLANSYYVGQMKSAKEGSDARKWGDAIKVIRPTFANQSGGTHVNVSGAAVAKNAPQRANAVKLIEFLVSEPAQALLCRDQLRVPGAQGRGARPDHRVQHRRAEGRPAAPHRDRQVPQAGQRAGGQGRLRPVTRADGRGQAAAEALRSDPAERRVLHEPLAGLALGAGRHRLGVLAPVLSAGLAGLAARTSRTGRTWRSTCCRRPRSTPPCCWPAWACWCW